MGRLQGDRPREPALGSGAVVGGILFGFGIVLAGGCETGWMYRTVEGQVHFWVVGLGNIAGATLLAWVWDAWGIARGLVEPWPRLNLVPALGWPAALALTYGLLLLAYLLLVWWESRTRFHRLQEAGSGEAVPWR